jgi:hypothetical protein
LEVPDEEDHFDDVVVAASSRATAAQGIAAARACAIQVLMFPCDRKLNRHAIAPGKPTAGNIANAESVHLGDLLLVIYARRFCAGLSGTPWFSD